MNLVLHGQWQAGALNGIVAPSMIVPAADITGPAAIVSPSMIVAPNMLQLDTALAPVAVAQADGSVMLMIGGVTATMSGSASTAYEGGLDATMAATATATLASGTGEDPTFENIHITDLSFGTDRVLTTDEQDQVQNTLIALAYFMTDYALNRGGPTLPVPSLMTSTDYATYGVDAGMRLGAVTPAVSITDAYVELAGNFGQRAAP